MHVSLVLLAEGTALNIAANEGGKSGPPEFSGDQLACFQEAGVAGRFMVMAAFEDGAAKRVIGGDIDMALVSEDACLDLPISKSRAKGKRDVLVHRLEGLENEGITRGCGFNVVEKGGVN